VRFDSAASIRQEIARAIPLYKGIEKLTSKGDAVQWGGPNLYEDGQFATADGKAHFAAVAAGKGPRAADKELDRVGASFVVSTRRGKQFNSMIQREVDPLTGAARNDILISEDDVKRLSLNDAASVRLRSAHGVYDGRLKIAPIRPGNLEVHWPEANVLLSGSAIDPDSMEPDYNAVVTLESR
jgi:predicted molibdopterin-dependent oxidoreductase YjgC